MKRSKYVDSGKVTADGQVIYNRLTGVKGRPSRWLKKGTGYVAYATPKPVKAVAVAVPAVA